MFNKLSILNIYLFNDDLKIFLSLYFKVYKNVLFIFSIDSFKFYWKLVILLT